MCATARVTLAVVWLLLGSLGCYSQMLFLLSHLKTGPWQSHGKGVSPPGKHVPVSGAGGTGVLGLSSTCRKFLQGWRWILLSCWFSLRSLGISEGCSD